MGKSPKSSSTLRPSLEGISRQAITRKTASVSALPPYESLLRRGPVPWERLRKPLSASSWVPSLCPVLPAPSRPLVASARTVTSMSTGERSNPKSRPVSRNSTVRFHGSTPGTSPTLNAAGTHPASGRLAPPIREIQRILLEILYGQRRRHPLRHKPMSTPQFRSAPVLRAARSRRGQPHRVLPWLTVPLRGRN